MGQPRAHAALGSDPIRTIGRDELKAKLDRGGDFKPPGMTPSTSTGCGSGPDELIARRSSEAPT